ncbi:MAG: transposase, partial [Acidobacteriota bacterium]
MKRRVIHENIDLSEFDRRYKNDHAGRPAWHPKILLKIILVGYSRGLITSRDIATACEENIVFMALAGEAKPDFTTIARFISSMAAEVGGVFCKVLLYCSAMDLIGGEMFAVDGHKITSNAANTRVWKEWSGTHDHLKEKAEKLRVMVADLLLRHKGTDQALSAPENKRMKKFEKGIAKIDAFLSGNEKRIGTSGKEVQSNITDNESAKMTSSHGVVQGYNGVAFVDAKNQIILHAEAFGSGQEHDLLKPMIEGTRKNMVAIGKTSDCLDGKKLAADSNYYTKENCKLVEEERIDAYIPDSQFRKRDPRYINAKKHKPQEESERKFREQDFQYQP